MHNIESSFRCHNSQLDNYTQCTSLELGWNEVVLLNYVPLKTLKGPIGECTGPSINHSFDHRTEHLGRFTEKTRIQKRTLRSPVSKRDLKAFSWALARKECFRDDSPFPIIFTCNLPPRQHFNTNLTQCSKLLPELGPANNNVCPPIIQSPADSQQYRHNIWVWSNKFCWNNRSLKCLYVLLWSGRHRL